jgi:hypothetical protein
MINKEELLKVISEHQVLVNKAEENIMAISSEEHQKFLRS